MWRIKLSAVTLLLLVLERDSREDEGALHHRAPREIVKSAHGHLGAPAAISVEQAERREDRDQKL